MVTERVAFPRQRPDVSYGRDPDGVGQWRYLGTPTPRSRNAGAFLGAVADLAFSHCRGFYDAPFSLEITTEAPGAAIVYTLGFLLETAITHVAGYSLVRCGATAA